ncbi:MAG: CoB--CoM heterodisulfide reductase iron-sulfur subunit A family protein [Deltaproteobacteria bacterium]|nr:CoB--CoM heterodisulfide reductase iron-sulfur subunit A family protein [Deltaproteobacteria bacterium]
MEPRVGVFVCHCGTNIAGVVDVARVAEAARTWANVVHAEDYKFMCSDPGQAMVKQAILRHKIDRVVVAACSPRMHEATFRKACAEAGLNPYLFEMANIREHCSWVHEDKQAATLKAIDIVRMAVAKARLLEPLETRSVKVEPKALVVGGGVAGIQAALNLANAGIKVVMVERQQSIGGRMAQLDKTFPTLDCSACILTPKMVQVAQHPNVTLYTCAEVEEVSGYVGNFDVTIRRKATYVDPDVCTACGICLEKCPKKTTSEFEEGLTTRKAVYRLFPQAVPGKPVVDRESCTYFVNGKCKVCERFCEPKAFRWDDTDKVVHERVGAILVATGYDLYDASALGQWGYGRFPDVITGIEFERLNNATGPTGGRILKKDGTEPKSVAILHCVGSRDRNYKEYCSRVCCMYSLKFAHLLREKTAATVWNFYIDMRCFGKGYEEFYNRLLHEGVKFVRGKAAYVTDQPANDDEKGRLVVSAEATTLGEVLRVPVDMVILASAVTPQPDAPAVARRFGMSLSPDGFFMEKHPKLEPFSTATDGVYLAGACQGPKDIPDAVAHGAAAASTAMALISRGEVEVEAATAQVTEGACSGCKVCQDICPYAAIGFDGPKKVATINPSLCKGCGTCVATCPSSAIVGRHFTDQQVLAQISALFAG